MERTVRGILSAGFSAYAATTRMPAHVHRAAWQLSACRTARLGGHWQGCPSDHVKRLVYHSCRHRLCPQCQGIETNRWLERQRSRLVSCGHHHLIFTLPHQLHPWWRMNRAAMMQLLFDTVRETLMCLCRDERYMGGMPGFISALHTWGRSLSFHPHIHCLVTDGGLDADGRWVRPRKSCFLPARVVMALFRGKLIAGVRRLYERGDLALPRDECGPRLHNLLNRLGRVKWNVHLCRRYEHGEGVMLYLSRYVRGGPLNNRQIVSANADDVTFRYQAHAGGGHRQQQLSLPPPSFIARYLEHAPLARRQTVRHYGLYAHRAGPLLTQARAVHEQAPVVSCTRITWQTYYASVAGPTAITHCRVCGAGLVALTPVARQRAPPH